MTAKNEAQADIQLFNYLKEKKFSQKWVAQKTSTKPIQECLEKSSKRENGNKGYPDFIYVNNKKKLLILIENKDSINDHESKFHDKPLSYAVDGVKHYLKFFTKDSLKNNSKTTQKYLSGWSIIGIAVSGSIDDEYSHLISTFALRNDAISDLHIKEIYDESDYLSIFQNIDLELISRNISKSSSEINTLLRQLDSQKRPILLSSLMICLFEREGDKNDFKGNYLNLGTKNIIRSIPDTVQDVLEKEGIDLDKIAVLRNEMSFIKTDHDLNNTTVLRDILVELENNVIPLFNIKSNYDIIGKFYEEFLRFAGISNVKKGIILTPNHITSLFTDLVELRTNDVIFDPCCGTGAFLIAGMNRLISMISESDMAGKMKAIEQIKESQLVGFEKSTTMYSLAISNMLFRGDGKSSIYNEDFFSAKADKILLDLKKRSVVPTIGFINPPFGGKDNKSNPTKKEIQFLERMLDGVTRYGVVIAPLSVYFKDDVARNRILSKHRLKYVINMPGELFQPNAATHTAVAVFETHIPHNNNEVVFYDMSDDGFILFKKRGRENALNKWGPIRNVMLSKLKDPTEKEDKISFLRKKISKNSEWIIQAHANTDYRKLTDVDFINGIKEHIIFQTKLKLDILDENLNALTLMEILNANNLTKAPLLKTNMSLNIPNWKEFEFGKIFNFVRGRRLVKLDQSDGEIAYISSTKENNGIDNFISPPSYMKVHQNALTLNNSGSVGYCFFHDYQFVASDHCTVITIKDSNVEMNKLLGLFLKPVIEAMKCKYNFAREVSDARLKNERINLPQTDEGKPDWKFMEEWVKSLPYSSSL
ncbi:N-6 DNA methylase [Parasphingorhabdus sp.]|uniref:N-6 DNA methylase n=1 Tax=Parasphingorhabdus sp. TaxID=2709688 RepID=UPI002B26CF6F|nr:N-6 DNA methylase [Parasphingorhabdus sp.]